MTDYRYPYTYAADFVRSYGPVSSEGVVLSRSDAALIREAIAEAIGMEDRELAAKLADAQLANDQDDEFQNLQTQRLMQAMFPQQQEDN